MKRFIILTVAAATFATMFFSDTNFASANGRSHVTVRVSSNNNGNHGRHHYGRFSYSCWLGAYNTQAFFDPITGQWYYFSPVLHTYVPITQLGGGLVAPGGLGTVPNGIPALPQGATQLQANNVPVTPNNQVQPVTPQ